MRPIDIINVTGLLMSEDGDELEQKLREKVEPRFIRTIDPTPSGSGIEHPGHAIEQIILKIQEAVRDIEQQFGNPNVLLVGRSYGAFMTLLAAIRMEFEKVSKAILIEGPLHPDIEVKPPRHLPAFRPFGAHYRERSTLAREAIERLKKLGTSRLVIIQGGGEDDVVPTAAQVLPEDFDTTEFLYDDFAKANTESGAQGLVVKLPPHTGGRGYRNHLCWSPKKTEMIGKIIEKVAL